jgi:ABC-2 type transport system ATP-binding protein
MEQILEVKEISKIFKNGRGVKQVSFDVFKGDVFGFIGPNGSGKTTILKIIMGLIHPDKGNIRIFGHNIVNNFELAMKQVGCMVETADAYDYMTAFENLRLSARFYPEISKSRIYEVLEQVGLNPYKTEKVRNYSLGMKQRLALGSALLSNPKLVILDEPTNGLDIDGIIDCRNTIRNLASEKGITFLISSHMINELSMVANRIGIMKNGSLISFGNVSDLLKEGMTLEQFLISTLHSSKGEDHDE